MYADEVTLYHKVNNNNDYDNFKADLSAIQTWALKWQMKINIDKCKVLHFGNKNMTKSYNLNKIMPSKCEKILGVFIDTECSFKQHIFNIVKKARMAASDILCAFKGCDITVMISLYKTYVRSILEYASVVFNSHCVCLINLLENVQRHYTKRLTGLWDANYDVRLKLCTLERLENRRVNNDLLLIYKLLHNKCMSCIKGHLCIQTTNTKGHCMKFFKSLCRLDIR